MLRFAATSILTLASVLPLSFSQVAILNPVPNQLIAPGDSFKVVLGYDTYIQNIQYLSASVVLIRSSTEGEADFIGQGSLDSSTSTGPQNNFSHTNTFTLTMPSNVFTSTDAILTVNAYALVGISLESWTQTSNQTIAVFSPNSTSSTGSSNSTNPTGNSTKGSTSGGVEKFKKFNLVGLLGLFVASFLTI